MSISMAIFTFINAWWIMLFFVLPFYIRPAESCKPLEYAAAPKPLRWLKILAVNTLVALLVTAGLGLLIDSHYIHLQDMR